MNDCGARCGVADLILDPGGTSEQETSKQEASKVLVTRKLGYMEIMDGFIWMNTCAWNYLVITGDEVCTWIWTEFPFVFMGGTFAWKLICRFKEPIVYEHWFFNFRRPSWSISVIRRVHTRDEFRRT